jgi:hypothetical protein
MQDGVPEKQPIRLCRRLASSEDERSDHGTYWIGGEVSGVNKRETEDRIDDKHHKHCYAYAFHFRCR